MKRGIVQLCSGYPNPSGRARGCQGDRDRVSPAAVLGMAEPGAFVVVVMSGDIEERHVDIDTEFAYACAPLVHLGRS